MQDHLEESRPGYDFWGIPASVFSTSLISTLLSLEHKVTVIEKKPCSARITCTNVQVLPDGREVHHETIGFVARDGSGRLRREESYWTPFANQLTTTVFIADPVLRCAYTLDSRNGMACELVPTWPSPADPGAQGILTLRVSTALGRRSIQGIRVEGRSASAVLCAHEKSIEVSLEEWYSRDLETVVLFKRADSLTGQTTYRLLEIVRTEPEPSLFEVPCNYRIIRAG